MDCEDIRYTVTGLTKGMEMDEKGKITVQTSEQISQTFIKVQIQVGTQTFYIPEFYVEVYDCSEFINIPELQSSYKYQIGSIIPPINAYTSTSDFDCMPKYYNIKNTKLPKEISLDQKRGILKIQNTQTLPTI